MFSDFLLKVQIMGFLESLIGREFSQNEIDSNLIISFRISNAMKRKKSGVVTTDYLPNWGWRSLDNCNRVCRYRLLQKS